MPELLERPLVPTRHRLDVDACYRMAETGILKPSERVELIEGEIIDMPAVGSPHAALVTRLNRLLVRALTATTIVVRVQDPLRLDEFNQPQPDLALLRPQPDDYRSGHPGADDVLLLV